MSLAAGTRLGPYLIEDLLGAGGMGEVYKARDTRLDRTVAIKVLPAEFSADSTLRQRLEREARAVSALDHPHICALYDIGSEHGVDFIVMQYLAGETLAARIARGPLPADDVCLFGAQIADALAAAHRRGIVHRDLKPGNIILTREGVRLLDFGLAKYQEPIAGGPSAQTVAAPLTSERSIVGTLHYMAPEQLEGRAVDGRTDIFALGAVLYEMLTGRHAFDGDSSASLITAIMTGRRAAIATLSPATPAALTQIVERCLATDPDDRWQSAGDLAYALRSVRQNSATVVMPAAAAPARSNNRVWRIAGPVLLAGILAAAAMLLWSRRDVPRQTEVRLALPPPEGLQIAGDVADFDPDFALSPDGARLAFVAVNAAGDRSLWVRDLASVTPREIAATTTARRPFWSPDGGQIGYLTDAGLTRISADGGTSAAIPSTVTPSPNANAAWTPDGRIIYEAAPGTEGVRAKALYAVPVAGGTATELTAKERIANEQAQRYPVALPDGRHFLYLSWTVDPAERGVYLGDLNSGERHPLVKTGFRAGFVAPDLLVYILDRALVAARFSIDDGRMIGTATPVATALALEAIPGQATYVVSSSGVIAYRPREHDVASELRWVDRTGRVQETFPPASDISVSIAPGGRRAAVGRVTSSSLDDERFPSNVWILDLSRRVFSRFTLDSSATDENPTWSLDGTQIAYATHRASGLADVWIQSAAGSGGKRIVASGPQNFHPIDWAADGTLLLHSYATGTGADDLDLYTLTPGSSSKPQPLDTGGARGSQAQGKFSYDGRWVAYASDESGDLEVYVQPRSGGGARTQVSSDGGGQPRWRADGRELFYVSLKGVVMSVPLSIENGELTPGRPVPLFTEPSLKTNNVIFFYGGAPGYDVTPDGNRFLVNRMIREPGAGPMYVILNWARPPR